VKPLIQPLRDGDPKSLKGWVLKGFIGEGGQSTIYLAEKDRQRAALKVMKKEYLANQKSVDRFFTEIRNLELLEHPNISRVLDVEDSGSFLAIEFIDGLNLEDYVKENGPLGRDAWLALSQSLTEAISYCHSKGIIHKDISPKNVIMGPNGPVLVDFGISYLEKDHRLTSDGEVIGTPPFMSPEHFGISAPKEMDIFSLGGTLIFAASGHYPFVGDSNSEWREAILYRAPDLSGLSIDQQNILSPLLYKKPEHRISLTDFSYLLQELSNNNTESKFVKKEFTKVKRDSPNKLMQKKKNLSVRNRRLRRIVSAASIVSLLSISLVASTIVVIQNRSNDVITDTSLPIGQTTKNAQPMATSDGKSGTNEEIGTLAGAIQKDKSPINKEIQANLDLTKKFYDANQLDKALTYAKLAAEAGNAQGMYRVAFILVDQGKSQEAIQWYEKAANLGYGDAFWNLGALYMKLGKTESGLSWYEKGVKNNNVGSMNSIGFYYGNKKGDYTKAITYYRKAADLGSVLGMSNLGIAYEEINDKANAKVWYSKASDLGSVDASINLGYLYEQSADWTNARKYYKRAADKKDPLGMYNLAIVMGNQFGMGDEGCVLLKDALLIDSIEVSTKKLIDTAIAKGCSGAQSTPKTSPKPVTSSDSFKVSPSLAANVEIDEIFGRAFKNGLNYWVVSLTTIKGAKVPEVTGIQFRLVGYPDAPWLGVPYKLKVDPSSGIVYAEVDDILFALVFKDQKYCPEFRAIREENGKIVQIWEKGKPECATDYNP
jgi:serine/threonine protein kinase